MQYHNTRYLFSISIQSVILLNRIKKERDHDYTIIFVVCMQR